MSVEGESIKLQIWYAHTPTHPHTNELPCRDTAGQERFRTLTHAYFRGADVSTYHTHPTLSPTPLTHTHRVPCYSTISLSVTHTSMCRTGWIVYRLTLLEYRYPHAHCSCDTGTPMHTVAMIQVPPCTL